MKTAGIVISASRIRWVRVNAEDGITSPRAIKVRYTVEGRDYFKWRWLSAGQKAPRIGSLVWVEYDEGDPRRARVI